MCSPYKLILSDIVISCFIEPQIKCWYFVKIPNVRDKMRKRFTYTNTYTQNKHTHGLNERKSYNTKIVEKNRVQ